MSQLTEQENFIFTDHEFTVEEIIKNNAASPIQAASPITITRDGGVVRLNNRILRAKKNDFDATIIGERYLLFLRFIPATGSYLTYGNGTFHLEAQKVIALGPGARDELSKGGSKNAASFLNDIRNFAKRECQIK